MTVKTEYVARVSDYQELIDLLNDKVVEWMEAVRTSHADTVKQKSFRDGRMDGLHMVHEFLGSLTAEQKEITL